MTAGDGASVEPDAKSCRPPVRRPWATPTVILPTRAVRMTEKTLSYPFEIHVSGGSSSFSPFSPTHYDPKSRPMSCGDRNFQGSSGVAEIDQGDLSG